MYVLKYIYLYIYVYIYVYIYIYIYVYYIYIYVYIYVCIYIYVFIIGDKAYNESFGVHFTPSGMMVPPAPVKAKASGSKYLRMYMHFIKMYTCTSIYVLMNIYIRIIIIIIGIRTFSDIFDVVAIIIIIRIRPKMTSTYIHIYIYICVYI
jgi:hypothetical protein